ncbi:MULTISPECIES: MaoC family dehydratase [Mycobacteroides]|jgi:MaoC like domain|uniref:Beta-hydroxyacyl-ACP dehydratase n=1 Tax=Mycobacteroides chelonae TaxID=1774 RepID=A0A1S1KCM7_MYCCH|nr:MULTISPECIES: MaoC family dehydratase [Mycobacteroides]PKQ55465.1 beta-hydroxyacyl-ACP dehydratase [Mycobacterium sp. MHSD3]SKL56347.1 putative dehydratase [Mycobacteroides abscessus subsp. bolletii]KRQ21783.1 beta-hydroxyacyl-ACP dehydratase [Mycobacteroides sp. H003]KRQ27980.1 beta-hydroxyacyl-ACP dehydratase [Mycobacteroides sp. H072]KRQ37124.1 beta-hydroxyacyl-ACP dehydratase [Mycobacteroides sp. H092]
MDSVCLGGKVTTVGEKLPELKLEGTPTFIVSTALATRDFQDVHHDRDLAQAKGSKDIFINILSDTGLVERFVTDWAGPSARVKSISLRLGVPWYAYDTTVFSGEVTAVDDGVVEVDVVGNNSLGAHVTAKVKLTIGASA